MNGTASQFSLSFDETSRVVNATTGRPYVETEKLVAGSAGKSAGYAPSPWKMKVNGMEIGAAAYNIAGNDYFRLRDLGIALGFKVNYDAATNTVSIASGGHSLVFDKDKCSPTLSYTMEDGTVINYRKYENIVYVANPVVPARQNMTVYVPEAYFHGGKIGNFTAQTAPIFLPNAIGGYRQASVQDIFKIDGNTGKRIDNALGVALSKGYVVVSPALRGWDTLDENGKKVGTAPAAIIDLKAVVRYLRYNDSVMPGDAEKIISDGTSAGGAMSALLATSGNSALYTPYLNEINAADRRDDIFASFVFCPILDMENLDMALEWFFSGTGLTDYDGMSTWNKPGKMTDDEILLSQELARMYSDYLNSLHLTDPETGKALTLNADGTGPYKDYIASLLAKSAQKELDSGKTIDSKAFNDALTIKNGKVIAVDLDKYLTSIHRLKGASSTDNGFTAFGTNGVVITFEMRLFGIRDSIVHFDPNLQTAINRANARGAHFTGDFTVTADVGRLVYLMNPMNFIDNSSSKTAPNIFVCAGAMDNDVSMCTATQLYLRLANEGVCNNLHLEFAWGRKHGGDYDLKEMFAWLDKILSQ